MPSLFTISFDTSERQWLLTAVTIFDNRVPCTDLLLRRFRLGPLEGLTFKLSQLVLSLFKLSLQLFNLGVPCFNCMSLGINCGAQVTYFHFPLPCLLQLVQLMSLSLFLLFFFNLYIFPSFLFFLFLDFFADSAQRSARSIQSPRRAFATVTESSLR
jgi:hypothetical protein